MPMTTVHSIGFTWLATEICYDEKCVLRVVPESIPSLTRLSKYYSSELNIYLCVLLPLPILLINWLCQTMKRIRKCEGEWTVLLLSSFSSSCFSHSLKIDSNWEQNHSKALILSFVRMNFESLRRAKGIASPPIN